MINPNPTPPARPTREARRPAPMRQRGVVMLFAMIALVIMLVGSVALMRSLGISMFNAGNISFKRDMANEAEVAKTVVQGYLSATGVLGTPVQRAVDNPAYNYMASMQATNAKGIPLGLLTDGAFPGNPARDITIGAQGVTIRYMLDRLCSAPGDQATLGAKQCILSGSTAPTGGSSSKWIRPEDAGRGGRSAAPLPVVYRLSVRVQGPRDTVSYFQSTFAQ